MANQVFQIYIGKDGQCHFRFVATDGKIVLTSEGYASPEDCTVVINEIKTKAGNNSLYKKVTEPNGQYSFILLIEVDELIAKSRIYKTGNERDNDISYIMHNAADATVEDLT
jgi:uncharacterized protein YegP (UPF0339 family)